MHYWIFLHKQVLQRKVQYLLLFLNERLKCEKNSVYNLSFERKTAVLSVPFPLGRHKRLEGKPVV